MHVSQNSTMADLLNQGMQECALVNTMLDAEDPRWQTETDYMRKILKSKYALLMSVMGPV